MTTSTKTTESITLVAQDIDEGISRLISKYPECDDYYVDAEGLLDALNMMAPEKNKNIFGFTKDVPEEDDIFLGCWVSQTSAVQDEFRKKKSESRKLLEGYRKSLIKAINDGDIKHSLNCEIIFYKTKVIFLGSLIDYGDGYPPLFKQVPLDDLAVDFMLPTEMQLDPDAWMSDSNHPWHPDVSYWQLNLTNNRGGSYSTRVHPVFMESLVNLRSEMINILREKHKNAADLRWKSALVKFPINADNKIQLNPTSDLEKILSNNQSVISQIKPELIKNFIQLFTFLNNRKKYLEELFYSASDQTYPNQIDYLVEVLQSEVEKYNLMMLNALKMLTAASENNLVTFYKIYEFFDNYSVFDSNWEKNLSAQMTGIRSDLEKIDSSIARMESSINANLWMLSSQIRSMESNMIEGMNSLAEATSDLNASMTNQLSSVNSKLNYMMTKPMVVTFKT